MADLYYLMSSLPALQLGQKPRLSYAQFLNSASGILPAGDFARLQAFSWRNPPRSLDGLGALEQKFWDWEAGLRNALVRLRAEALRLKADQFLRPIGSSGLAESAAKAAFAESDPLSVEKSLNKARWELLESFKDGSAFTFGLLLVYSMQLQILERYAHFDAEKGKNKYDEEYTRILSDAQTVLAENI